MKVAILAIGRLRSGPEQALFNRYFDLFNSSARNLKIGPVTLVELAEGRGSNVFERKAEEAAAMLAKAADGSRVIALDEAGQTVASQDFTAMLGRLRDEALDVAFALGGPDGHGDSLRNAAHFTLSLGPMTLPHGLARIVLAEQLYRAVTIMQGHPYHRA